MSEKQDILTQLGHAQEKIKHAEGMLKETGISIEFHTHILSATNALRKVSIIIHEEIMKRG